jgi:hypothetical protein
MTTAWTWRRNHTPNGRRKSGRRIDSLVHGATTEEVEAITGLSLKEFTHNPGSVYHAMANIFARHGISYSFADFEREKKSALRDPAPPE